MSDAMCCPLSENAGGAAPVTVVTTPMAAKQHQCCECQEPIPKGTRHEHYKLLSEGTWGAYRTCLICVEIRNHFACNGWIFERLWEDLQDNFFPDMRAGGPCMAGLSPEAKGRLVERRMAWLFERKIERDGAPPPEAR